MFRADSGEVKIADLGVSNEFDGADAFLTSTAGSFLTNQLLMIKLKIMESRSSNGQLGFVTLTGSVGVHIVVCLFAMFRNGKILELNKFWIGIF